MKKLLLLVLMLALAACAGNWPPPILPTVEELAANWQQGEKPIKMQGEMMLTLPDSQYSAEHTLTITPTGQFRLEVNGPFDKRVFTVVCDGLNLLAIYYDENRAYSGEASPQNLARLLGMELDPQRIYAVLSAQAPFWIQGLSQGRVIASSNPGEILLLMPQEQSITFKLESMQVQEASLREADGSMVQLTYRWRGQQQGLPLSMEMAAQGGRALNLYNDRSDYIQYNADDFKLPEPGSNMPVYKME